MAKLTDKSLYEFVYRADTAQKIATAERWLKEHKHVTSPHVLDDLLRTLAQQSKRLFFTKFAEETQLCCVFDSDNNVYLTNTITGEVLATA